MANSNTEKTLIRKALTAINSGNATALKKNIKEARQNRADRLAKLAHEAATADGTKRKLDEFSKADAERKRQEDIEKEVLQLEQTKKYLEGKSPKKIIIVPNKIVNIVV